MNTATTHRSVVIPSRTDPETWLDRLARLGYAARGVIYATVGGLALLSAFGSGGKTTDTKGAIAEVMDAPGGWLLVLVIAIGLAGYSVWRFCQSVLDADGRGRDGKAIVIRIGYFLSSLAHLLLAIWAGKLAFGRATEDGGSSSHETLVAMAMSKPFGHWLVGIAGLILIGVGIAQFTKGHRESFEKYFRWDYDKRRWLIGFCKFGLYIRGVIFAIIGGFIIYAAVTTDPAEAGGLQDALQWVGSQPFGPWLLGIVGAGLISFGIFSLVQAFYRRVQPIT